MKAASKEEILSGWTLLGTAHSPPLASKGTAGSSCRCPPWANGGQIFLIETGITTALWTPTSLSSSLHAASLPVPSCHPMLLMYLSHLGYCILPITPRYGSSLLASAHASPQYPPLRSRGSFPSGPIRCQTYLGFSRADVSGALPITKWLIRKADVMGGNLNIPCNLLQLCYLNHMRDCLKPMLLQRCRQQSWAAHHLPPWLAGNQRY